MLLVLARPSRIWWVRKCGPSLSVLGLRRRLGGRYGEFTLRATCNERKLHLVNRVTQLVCEREERRSGNVRYSSILFSALGFWEYLSNFNVLRKKGKKYKINSMRIGHKHTRCDFENIVQKGGNMSARVLPSCRSADTELDDHLT